MQRVIHAVHGESVAVSWVRDGYWLIDWPQARVPMADLWHAPSPAQYEAYARDVFLQEFTPAASNVVVDVGAGVGWELNLFSGLVGPSGRVYAIEADPDTFRWLVRRAELNGLGNVTPIHAALADEPGEVIISSEGWDETHHLVAEGPGHRVQALRFDDLVDDRGITRVDFLKMNIEGAERSALTGMGRRVDLVRNVAISCHDFLADHGGDDSMRTRAFVRRFLLDHGFEVIERRPDDDREWVRSYLYGRRRGADDAAAAAGPGRRLRITDGSQATARPASARPTWRPPERRA
jgi:FkbM family methyltransferase